MDELKVTYCGEYKAIKYGEAVFQYEIHIPEKSNDDGEYGLILCHDGLNQAEAIANEFLAESGAAPHCIAIGIGGGNMIPTVENGKTHGLRMNAYDFFSGKFPDFIVDEFLPYLVEKYCLKISSSADMHVVTGGSSGGISSWNIAWHRTDYFKRVYMSSPSFLEMGKGQELVTLMRKFETKPIRVYTEFSENEPNDYFGSSFCVAKAAEMALEFAGYDMKSAYYPQEGHCSRRLEYESAVERLRFLWKDWKNKPVEVTKLSPRMGYVFSVGDRWCETEDVFPEKIQAVSTGLFTPQGEYIAVGSKIIFVNSAGEQKIVADGFSKINSLLISPDKWRLYIGDENRSCVYAANIQKDGSLGEIYVQAALHLNTDFRTPGVFDMCIDSEDRIYAATEVGIQTIRSYGLIDVILSNPKDGAVEKIEIDNDGFLVAKTKEKQYKRKLRDKKRPQYDVQTEPKSCSYYD